MRPIFAGLTLFVFLAAPIQAEDDIFSGAPKVPPGYTTYQAAQLAVLSGKVPAIKDPESVPASIETRTDLIYHSPGGAPLKIDVYMPKAAVNPAPALLFIHGGGWRKGDKRDYLFYTVKFAEMGYVTASVQYRFSPTNRFPSALHDVKHAIAYLRLNASSFNIDASKIAVIGGSAGGHLALMAGYAEDAQLECPDSPPGVSTRVQAVINFYGVVDCTAPVAREASEVTDFIGQSFADAPEEYAAASPIHHLDRGDPPTLTFHGTIDELVPVAQADVLHERLSELGIANYYDRIEGWPHGMDLAKPINDRARYVIERFLELHLPLP